jgi:F-type H+-transporting ATPase subunit epsilon
MHLKVLLPFRILLDVADVSRIVAETQDGSFGLLPRRRDCVAALVPGILTYESEGGGEVFVAVDEGVLVKFGDEVRVAVPLDAVQNDYLKQDALELSARAATQKLESGFVGRFARFHAA